ncbi:hypothetical protein WAF17_08745 [Bernardetia sp. ABR2-2B]|uniref:hypothetical protein n=1 Tax=Bernardetia sp. ABR2-2B TaxID=3127472 RepID=UPI0030CB790D
MNYSEIISSTNFMGSEPTIRIEGQVDLEVYTKMKKAFSKGIDINSLCFFSSYSGFEIELNHKFEVIFDENNPLNYTFLESELLEVTQQFAFPEQQISRGWKHIIIVSFNPFIPNIIKELPIVDNWFIGKAGIRLSSKTFYKGYRDLYLS